MIKQINCIECGIYLEKGKKNDKWCSMKCKQITFDTCFKDTQFTNSQNADKPSEELDGS